MNIERRTLKCRGRGRLAPQIGAGSSTNQVNESVPLVSTIISTTGATMWSALLKTKTEEQPTEDQTESLSRAIEIKEEAKVEGKQNTSPVEKEKPLETNINREELKKERSLERAAQEKKDERFESTKEWYNRYYKKLREEKEHYKILNEAGEMKSCIKEITGDLFKVADDVSLAHCVSEDLEMGKGIAREFRKLFGKVDELRDQKQKVGGCAYISADGGYIFNLITKRYYSEKPLYSDLEKSLTCMREWLLKLKVKKLAMPMIGCGLDELDWTIVSNIINKVYAGKDIQISIYSLGDSKTTNKRGGKFDDKKQSKIDSYFSNGKKDGSSSVKREGAERHQLKPTKDFQSPNKDKKQHGGKRDDQVDSADGLRISKPTVSGSPQNNRKRQVSPNQDQKDID